MKVATFLAVALACAAVAAERSCHAGSLAELSHPHAHIWYLYRAPSGCLTTQKAEYRCQLTDVANRNHVLTILKDYNSFQWEQANDHLILVNCVDCPITQLANVVKTKIETAFDCQFLN